MRRTPYRRAGGQGALAATVTMLALGLCATSAPADKGGVPHAGSNGRGAQGSPPPATPEPAEPEQDQGQADQQAPPAKPAKRHKKTSDSGEKPRRARPERPERAAAPAAQEHASNANPGKTTICHRTGSQTNPWVQITVANRALKAHSAHGDIVPAPAGGCPKPQGTEETPPPSPGGGSTSDLSGTTITANSLAPGTVALETAAAGSQAQPAGTGTAPSTAAAGSQTQPAPSGEVLGETVSSTGSGSARGSAPSSTAGTASVSQGTPTAPTAAAAAARTGSGLPFTGWPAWLLALAGAGALLGGVALRRARVLGR